MQSDILDKFCPPGSTRGLDNVIPSSIMRKAKGIAIFTVFRAGFLMSARVGSGVVLAKLPNGEWSAPTAIGIGGLGGGFNVGAEMVDVLIVLVSSAAVRSFMSIGSLQLGGNLGLAVGPLGRSGEASAALSADMKMAAMFSYSMSRGLYGGVTIEGTILIDRQDANTKVYGKPYTPDQILTGEVDPPEIAMPLVTRLEEITSEAAANCASLADDASDSSSVRTAPCSTLAGGYTSYAPDASSRRSAPPPPGRARHTQRSNTNDLDARTMDDLDRQLQTTHMTAPPPRPQRKKTEPSKPPRPTTRAPSSSFNEAGYVPYRGRAPPVRTPTPEAGVEEEDPFADMQSSSNSPPYKTYQPRRRAALVDVDDDDDVNGESLTPVDERRPSVVSPTLLESDLVVALHDFEAVEPTDLQ
ncbi:hypothetical protein MVES_000675 [Malassezia vespertilionis]|uniref:Ysc84 actin-binding domain-containing protein n=1 Tax=Malassezia vespertilionis TaxID=2020962 RepID=A0A2N1JGH7_9BASI|nr:hypothetical protein MVES_000675 [Malassezia vespertilionis]